LLGDVRAILKNFQQWPTAAQADSQYQTFIREQVPLIQRHGRNLAKSQLAPHHPLLPSPPPYAQFVESQESADSEVAKARRQQAKDYALMLKNLDRQKVQ